MKKLKIKKWKVLLITFLISLNTSGLFGQNEKVNPIEIKFNHNENQLHGWLYKANGNGPFPTAILLHGSVGQDGDIFNLGESLSKEGFNVMSYNYPGSWRSEGNRTDDSALGSVQSAINFVKSDYSIQSFETDTSDIILIGYSYGGGMALLGSINNQSVKRVIAIAGGDLSVTSDEIRDNPNFKNSFTMMVNQLLSNPNLARGTTAEEYVELLLKNRDKYDLKKNSENLINKEILLLVGWLDNTKKIENDMLPLFRELKSKGAKNIKIYAYETNHSFTNVQKEFTETIINWLRKKE